MLSFRLQERDGGLINGGADGAVVAQGTGWGNLMTDGNQQRGPLVDHDTWDAYLADIERIIGRSITDARTIDMLYALYLRDLDPRYAAGNMEGLQHASVAVQSALETIMAAKTRRESEMVHKDVQSPAEPVGNTSIVRRQAGDPIEVFLDRRHPRHRRRRQVAWGVLAFICALQLALLVFMLLLAHFQ